MIVRLAICAALGLSGPVRAEEPTAEGHVWAQSRGPMPFDIIRSLQFLQDQVARGNDRAIRVQALLLRRFGPVFLSSGAEVWADPRNRRAAVLFVLSGGPPAVLKGLMDAGVLPEEQRSLFEGALAYVENDLARARDLLSAVDLDSVEPGLAGHIHLVLGQIMQNEDVPGAVVHLDRARLLAPGGLIEEAALRLEIMLVDGLGDHAQSDRLARQYFDRYSRSSYSANFEARFAAIFSDRAQGDADQTIATMDDVIAGLPDDRRRGLYLSVGRRALVEGRLAFAHLSAGRALAIGGLSPDDEERARLYDIASSLAARPVDEARAALASLARERLHVEDLRLLDAADEVLAAINLPPTTLAAADDEPLAASPVVDRAERILSEISSDLGSASR